MTKDFVVARLEPAIKLLRQVTDAPSAKRVADMAVAAQVYAKRQKLGDEAIASAHRIRVDAMTMLGEFLRRAPKDKGAIGKAGPGRGKRGAKSEPRLRGENLAGTDIPRKEAAMAQKLCVMAENDPERYKALRESGKLSMEAMIKPQCHVSKNSGENEWYTPEKYIEAARVVMGGIDLDPASSDEANEVVKATKFYTIKTNGLAQPWHGRVWMNPPYEGQLVKDFINALFAFVSTGIVKQATVLVNNATETAWFQQLGLMANSLCFLSGRVRYWNTEGTAFTPLQGQVVAYIGDRTDIFMNVFKPLGFVCSVCK